MFFGGKCQKWPWLDDCMYVCGYFLVSYLAVIQNNSVEIFPLLYNKCQRFENQSIMAPVKQPYSIAKIMIEYVKIWIHKLVKDIAENDQNGNYNKKIEVRLKEMRNYLEMWLPVSIASNLIENIFNDARLDTAVKFAALKILHFPDRTTKLILGK